MGQVQQYLLVKYGVHKHDQANLVSLLWFTAAAYCPLLVYQ